MNCVHRAGVATLPRSTATPHVQLHCTAASRACDALSGNGCSASGGGRWRRELINEDAPFRVPAPSAVISAPVSLQGGRQGASRPSVITARRHPLASTSSFNVMDVTKVKGHTTPSLTLEAIKAIRFILELRFHDSCSQLTQHRCSQLSRTSKLVVSGADQLAAFPW